jgi:hypothetical protein
MIISFYLWKFLFWHLLVKPVTYYDLFLNLKICLKHLIGGWWIGRLSVLCANKKNLQKLCNYAAEGGGLLRCCYRQKSRIQVLCRGGRGSKSSKIVSHNLWMAPKCVPFGLHCVVNCLVHDSPLLFNTICRVFSHNQMESLKKCSNWDLLCARAIKDKHKKFKTCRDGANIGSNLKLTW